MNKLIRFCFTLIDSKENCEKFFENKDIFITKVTEANMLIAYEFTGYPSGIGTKIYDYIVSGYCKHPTSLVIFNSALTLTYSMFLKYLKGDLKL